MQPKLLQSVLNRIQKNFYQTLFLIAIIYLLGVLLAIYWDGWPRSERTGQIGDTFGGLIGPLVNLATIIFLYRTFKIEHDRSLLEEERVTAEAFYSRIERYHKLIDEFKYVDLSGLQLYEAVTNRGRSIQVENTHYGVEAMELFFRKNNIKHNCIGSALSNIQILYISISTLFGDVLKFHPKNEIYKKQVEFNLRVLYSFKLNPVILASQLIVTENINEGFIATQVAMKLISESNAALSPSLAEKKELQ